MQLNAAVYKNGKLIKMTKGTVEIGMMRWGKNLIGEDRLIGSLNRCNIPKDLNSKDVLEEMEKVITLTIDVRDIKNEVIDTIDLKFNLATYGYKKTSRGYKAKFCVDFMKIDAANRIFLKDVQVGGVSVTYKTFNMSNSLLKTAFKLPKPKVKPIKH